jgi:hypothetical protein
MPPCFLRSGWHASCKTLPNGKGVGKMDANKAAVALRACWTIIETSQRPLEEVGEYFNSLAKDCWSSAEIQELQSQVIQRILEKWRGPDAHET